jgi:regulatory protein
VNSRMEPLPAAHRWATCPFMARRNSTPPPPLTEARLEATGLWYVERYGGTSQALRRALWRKVDRVGQHHETDRQQAAQWIDAIVARFQRGKLVDDEAWARSKARSLFARGKPPWKIRGELSQKGVDAELAQQVVEQLTQTREIDPQLEAAVTYARRRRLGPYRPEHQREERRERDMGAMARAGFGWAIAREVIDAENLETLAALLEP